MKYLFLFTISPVQAFISQARKAQDLYAGSLILSDLMKSVVEKIEEEKNEIEGNNEIIFPKIKTPQTSATHRILAIINTDDIKQYADTLKQNAENKFLKFAKPVIELNPASEKQLKSFFEFYWVAKEYDETKHLQEYAELEKLLAGVKNTRYFRIFEEEPGRKGSLHSNYNVLFYRGFDGSKDKNKLAKTKIFNTNFLLVPDENNKITLRQLNRGEGLSAIGFLKRLYKSSEIDKFPSTAEIALKELENQNKIQFQNYKKLFKKNEFPTILTNHFDKINIQNLHEDFNENFDYQYFFSENLADKEFLNKHQLQWVKKWNNKFIKPLIGENKNRYYAIIVFDGDNMGKWLSGEYVDGNKGYHKDLSDFLSEFSNKAKRLVESKGKTVYSGGDDFLAFVNLNYLFKLIIELRKLFDTEVNKKLKTKYAVKFLAGDKNLSFSAGIAIAHYKDPLSINLDLARKMLEEAKEFKIDKNSLGIAVLKGSGGIEKSIIDFGDNKAKNIDIVQNIFKQLSNEEYSTTFITNFNREMAVFMDEKRSIKLDYEIIKTELYRLIKRSANFQENIDKKSKEFSEIVISLYRDGDMGNFLSLLNICDFITRNITNDEKNKNTSL